MNSQTPTIDQINEALEILRWTPLLNGINHIGIELAREMAIIKIAWWYLLDNEAEAEWQIRFWSKLLGSDLKRLAEIRQESPLQAPDYIQNPGYPRKMDYATAIGRACEGLISKISDIEYDEMMR